MSDRQEQLYSDSLLQHMANATSQYDPTCRALAEEILALRADLAQAQRSKAELDEWKTGKMADATGHMFRCAKVNGRWVCAKGCAQQQLAGVRAALAQAIPLLRTVRTLDIGAHYCRYCPAKSPAWEHVPSCPYVESQREYDEARKCADDLAALLARLGARAPGEDKQP